MLVLTRKVNEEIVIGHNIRIRVVGISRGKVRLGVIAPLSIRVDRAEIDANRRQWDEAQTTPKPEPEAA
jgi:carbon storage regulator